MWPVPWRPTRGWSTRAIPKRHHGQQCSFGYSSNSRGYSRRPRAYQQAVNSGHSKAASMAASSLESSRGSTFAEVTARIPTTCWSGTRPTRSPGALARRPELKRALFTSAASWRFPLVFLGAARSLERRPCRPAAGPNTRKGRKRCQGDSRGACSSPPLGPARPARSWAGAATGPPCGRPSRPPPLRSCPRGAQAPARCRCAGCHDGRGASRRRPRRPDCGDLGVWDTLPAVEIRVRAGEVLRARLRNRLLAATRIHWHGIAQQRHGRRAGGHPGAGRAGGRSSPTSSPSPTLARTSSPACWRPVGPGPLRGRWLWRTGRARRLRP